MPIRDYSQTAASNTSISGTNIAEGCAPSGINDAIRQMMADVREVQASASIASASTVNIGAANAEALTVTGTTTITAFDSVAAGVRRELTFSGALTLTHNATSLILPGGANITTAAGDVAVVRSLGSGNWRCVSYVDAATASARSRLGLGTAATQNTGTSGANVPLLNAANTWSATQTFANNAIDLQSGQIAFPATQSASAGANTLDDYEEGTWTPNDASGASLSFSNVSGSYVKVGQMVLASFRVTYPSTANGTRAAIGGLPFTTAGVSAAPGAVSIGYQTYASQVTWLLNNSNTSMEAYAPGGGSVTNANLSTTDLRATIMYRANA